LILQKARLSQKQTIFSRDRLQRIQNLYTSLGGTNL